VDDQGVLFYLVDGSMIKGAELFQPMGDDTIFLDIDSCASPIDWQAEGVDIQTEYGDCSPNQSIHDWLEASLLGTDAEVIVYDHRPGECSDFVTIKADAKGFAEVELYHCKASGNDKTGDRTKDVYEVNGQAIKSAKYRNRRQLLKHLQDRLETGSRLVRGTREQLTGLLSGDPRYEVQPRITIVQPGISASAITPKIANLLASVNRGLVSVGCPSLGVLCSK
jgi:hypothetical protein